MSLNWVIENYECVESTQDILKEISSSTFTEEGLVISAQTQTAGRGRHGNVWKAPKGNLYISFLLHPECEISVAGHFSFLIAVALSKTIDKYIDSGHEKSLKWPNDILIDGKKCAGILLESNISPKGTISDLYVGVGVNILAPPEERIGLQQVSSQILTVESVLNTLLKTINIYYDLYSKKGFKEIQNLWISEAYRLHEKINVRLPQKTLSGIFEGLDEEGTLLLRLDNGVLERITAGEVYF